MFKSIRTRVLLLLAGMSALLALGFLLLDLTQHRQLATAKATSMEELRGQVVRGIELLGATQKSHTNDYSWWNDFVNFIDTRDPTWASQNIEVGIVTAGCNAAWVFTPDMELVYATAPGLPDPEQRSPPVAAGALKSLLTTRPFQHFFASTAQGLMELRTAPVQIQSDMERTSPARGYYLTARLWDEEYTRKIGEYLVAETKLLATDPAGKHDPAELATRVQIVQPLLGLDGKPVQWLSVNSESKMISQWQRDLKRQILMYVVTCGGMLLGLFIALTRWVSNPFKLLSRALVEQNEALISKLEATHTEFAGIAELLHQSHQQHTALSKENRERRELQDQLTQLANHDPLTGLANRHLFRKILDASLTQAGQHNTKVAVLYVDLDRFKNVNDMHGHAVGDSLLLAIAERLQYAARHGDTIARIGGDEFLICLNDVLGLEDVTQAASRILHTLAPPLRVDDRELFPAASIGISIFPEHGRDSDTLIGHADQAMYRAKQTGRNAFYVFDAALKAHNTLRLRIEAQLHRVLERNELHLHYQPRVSSRSTDIVSVEVLARWTHAEFGEIAPDLFIPVAEETGLVTSIGLWVLREACKQQVAWRTAGFDNLRMAVNLSARQLQSKSFADDVLSVIRETGIEPQNLELELTESTFLSNLSKTAEVMTRLSAFGVRFAIDDFGVGYSSLSYLTRLPVHTLKIDRSFVHGSESNAAQSRLIAGIISLAHGLGVTVVAEGVEVQEQLDLVRNHGCDEIQGYLIGRPQPAVDLELSMLVPRMRQRPQFAVVVNK